MEPSGSDHDRPALIAALVQMGAQTLAMINVANCMSVLCKPLDPGGDDGDPRREGLQKDKPEGEKAANWLPTGDGPFWLIMRMYVPGEKALNGSYMPPPVERVE